MPWSRWRFCPAGWCWPVAGSAAVAQRIAGCILPSGRCAVEVAAIWSPWHYFARCLCLPWSSALIAIVRSRSCFPDRQCLSLPLPQCRGCLEFRSRLLICRDGYCKNLCGFCLQGLFFAGLCLEEQHVLTELGTQICCHYLWLYWVDCMGATMLSILKKSEEKVVGHYPKVCTRRAEEELEMPFVLYPAECWSMVTHPSGVCCLKLQSAALTSH